MSGAWLLAWGLCLVAAVGLGFAAQRYVRHECGEAFGRGVTLGRAFSQLSPDQVALIVDGTGVEVDRDPDTDAP